MERKSESGQALVLILLSLSVVLTLVLFILSRSVTDVAVSSTQEQSVRAFSAAEAGIERALVTSTSYTTAVPIGNATYTAIVSNFAEGLTEFNHPFLLSSGDSATVWFMAHDPDGNLTTTGAFTGSGMTICWGSGAPSAASPAIEISVLYESTPGNLATINIARWALDPYSGRTPSNSFSTSLDSGTCTVANKSYAFHKTITLPATTGLILARVKMFYNNTPQGVGVSVTGDTLPSQGRQIDSRGVAGSSNRRIIVFQSWAESPFSSNAVLTPLGITK